MQKTVNNICDIIKSNIKHLGFFMSEIKKYNPENNQIKQDDKNLGKNKITRREFLKKSGLALLGLTLFGTKALGKAEKQPDKKLSDQPEAKLEPEKPKVEEKENKLEIDENYKDKIDEKVKKEINNIFKTNNFDDLIKICEKVQGYSESVKKYAKEYNVDERYLYAIIFVESKGDPSAYNENSGAFGLCQFTQDTAQQFNLSDRGNEDDSIRATAKYLQYYKNFIGRDDLNITSFNIGYGRLQELLEKFTDKKIQQFPKELVISEELSYPKIYFEATKEAHPNTNLYMNKELGEEGKNYYFKILAAIEVLKMHRKDPENFKRLSQENFK